MGRLGSGTDSQMNFQGNELNYLDTLFRVGYALFLIVSKLNILIDCRHQLTRQPSQLILTSVRPKFWLPPLELAWGVLTGMTLSSHGSRYHTDASGLMAVSQSVKGMYALRFFIGVFEASSYPGIVTILCNW